MNSYDFSDEVLYLHYFISFRKLNFNEKLFFFDNQNDNKDATLSYVNTLSVTIINNNIIIKAAQR